jgi:hypothetical protein
MFVDDLRYICVYLFIYTSEGSACTEEDSIVCFKHRDGHYIYYLFILSQLILMECVCISYR